MAEPADTSDKRGLEHELDELKASMEKYHKGEVKLTSEVVTDLGRAIHDLSGHMVDLHRRIEKIEQTHDDWTTRGWMPPPGSDRQA
jgi:hypothetical protein